MRLCKNCEQPLAPTKRSHAVFCNVVCKKQEEHRRRYGDALQREKNKVRARAWRDQNPEQAKVNVSRWHKANSEKSSANKAKYSYAKSVATPSWVSEDQLFSMATLHKLCRKLEKLTSVKYQVDHIVPLQGKNFCGLNVPWNLQVLEASLNRSKSNRPFAKLGAAGSLYWDSDTTILREGF